MAKRAQTPKAPATRPAGATRPASQRPGKYVAPKKKAVSPALLVGIIAAVVIVAVGLIWLAMNAAKAPIEATERVGEGTGWGPEGAPVTVINYSDFGCSFCGRFARNQGKQLREEYEGTANVRFEFKHFIIEGPNTRNAANAAECAADQGKFWDYHDVLFSRQGTSANPFSKDLLKSYGSQLGLDMATFNTCVDRDLHIEKVLQDHNEGRGRGVNSTPSFFINGTQILGAQDYSVFKSTIDAALAGS
jgi:protein-disulfide isomerase